MFGVEPGQDHQRWDADDRLSFEDSERFEEDSLCSWLSESESVCNNWRGWTGGTATSTSRHSQLQSLTYTCGVRQSNLQQSTEGKVLSLVELCAQEVAKEIPFEVVERFFPPVPENLQLRIAFWSFPESEEDIRLYSCLANGNVEEFQKGEHLFKNQAVHDLLQIGFHLSAVVQPQNQSSSSSGGGTFPEPSQRCHGISYNIAVTLDRRRITSCTCTCSPSASWCSHIVAVCLHRIKKPASACLRAPVSESLNRLNRDQLQKFAQYLISELPRQILPTAQKLLDELLQNSTAINTLTGAPDPTAGASVLDVSNWSLDEAALHRNIRKILEKFCIPSPTVLSDVNYLSSTAPPAATEWQAILQPLVGRLPEGLWNLLSIVREMYQRHDHNAVQLLHIVTQEVITSDPVVMWWYNTKLSQALIGNQVAAASSKPNLGNTTTAQHSCAFLCDEIVVLWRLAALDPKLSLDDRAQLLKQLRSYHLKVIEKVAKLLLNNNTANSNNNDHHIANNQHQNEQPQAVAPVVAVDSPAALGSNDAQHIISTSRLLPTDPRRFDFDAFPGFKPAFEACLLDWFDFTFDGVTYAKEKLFNCGGGVGGGQQLYHCGKGSDAGSSCTIVVGTSAGGGGSSGALSPLSQGCISPSLPVLRDKQFKNFSSLKQLLSGGGTANNNSNNGNSAASSNTNTTTHSHSAPVGLNGFGAELQLIDNSDFRAVTSAVSKLSLSSAYQGTPTKPPPASLNDSAVNSSDESGHESSPGSLPSDNAVVCPTACRRSSTPTSPSAFVAEQMLLRSFGPNNNACEQGVEVLSMENVGQGPSAEAKGQENREEPADDLEKIYCYSVNNERTASTGTGARPKANQRASPVEYVEGLFRSIQRSTDEFEVMFARAEALYNHGYNSRIGELAFELGQDLLNKPPDFMLPIIPCVPIVHAALTPTKQGRRSRRGLEQPVYIHPLAYKTSHLVHSTMCKVWFLANVNAKDHTNLAFRLCLFGLELPRQPAATKFLEVKLNNQEMELLALLKKIPLGAIEMEILRDRARRLRSNTYSQRPLPVLPVSLATFIFDSLCWNDDNFNPYRLPADELLGFEAAVAVLGLKPCVSEAEHPLLCEGARRQRGELALSLLLRYKDQTKKIAVIMDRLLDREMHQMYKNHISNAAFYGYEDPVSCPSSANTPVKSVMRTISADALPSFHRMPASAVPGCYGSEDAEDQEVSAALEDSFYHTDDPSFFERDDINGSPIWEELRVAMEPGPKVEPTELCTLSGYDASSTDSSSSGISRAGRPSLDLSGPGGVVHRSSPASPPTINGKANSVDLSSKTVPFKVPRGRRRLMPSQPNQPSEAQAHFLFELAKTLLTKAGGSHSTAIFSAGAHGNAHAAGGVGPHRGLHLCAFQIGLYALGLHNRVSPNWLSRTYSSHVSWISGQAMEIGRVALRLLIDTWENHLTPTEVANLADKASQGRDPAMVQAAAELALSALPHAHALNPTEIQRSLTQCKEQNQAMLEKACLAVENAAKDGGVYPEILFLVARQWFILYTEANGNDALNDNCIHHLHHMPQHPNNQELQPVSSGNVPSMQPPSLMPAGACAVLPFLSNNVVSQMQAHPMPYMMPMGQPNPHMMPSHLPHPQQNQHNLQQHPNYQLQFQMPSLNHSANGGCMMNHSQMSNSVVGNMYPMGMQQPQAPISGAFPQMYNPLQYLPSVAAASPSALQMSYSIQATFMANDPGAYPAAPMINVKGFPSMLPPPHGQPNQGRFVSVLVRPSGLPLPAGRLHPSHSAPNLAPNPPPPPCDDPHTQHQDYARCLYAAYRVGMLAMDTMGRRIHDDNRNYVKYAPNPPYGDDVKWLFKIAKKLGLAYVQHFSFYAAVSVVSPFVLHDIALEAAQLVCRGTNPLLKALHPPHIQPHIQELVRKYIEMFELAAVQKLSHPRFTPSDAEELITLVRTARQAFSQVGANHQFEVLLHSKIKKTKACKKELWNRLLNALNS